MSWYWCLKHSAVEPKEGCREADRLGPYDSREQAEGAVAALHARDARISAEDEEWEEGAPT